MVSHLNRTPEVVRGCRFRHGVACNVLCITGVACRVALCDDSLPPPQGWQFGVPIGGPRMSPTPRSAKYGATHGCNPSRGCENARLWSSSADGGVAAMVSRLWAGTPPCGFLQGVAIAGAPGATMAYCKKCAPHHEAQGTEYILGEVWLLHHY